MNKSAQAIFAVLAIVLTASCVWLSSKPEVAVKAYDSLVSRLTDNPLEKYRETYDIKGQLKEDCFFIFHPGDGGPTRNIENSGPTDRPNEVMLSITDSMQVRPHFAYVYRDDELPYWQWQYRFVLDPDGNLWVLEPKGQDAKSDYFVCPPERP